MIYYYSPMIFSDELNIYPSNLFNYPQCNYKEVATHFFNFFFVTNQLTSTSLFSVAYFTILDPFFHLTRSCSNIKTITAHSFGLWSYFLRQLLPTCVRVRYSLRVRQQSLFDRLFAAVIPKGTTSVAIGSSLVVNELLSCTFR